MQRFPTTRLSLLLQLKNSANQAAWEEFVEVYSPVIYRFARQRGFQDADAQDLAQNVLSAVADRIHDFQTENGRARFRTWLYRIASNQTITMYRRRRPDTARGGTTAVAVLERQTCNEATELKRNYRREVFRMLARRARMEFEEATWQAFWMTAVDEIPVEETARSLGRTIGAIYTARSRVIRRLQEMARAYDRDFAEGEPGCEVNDE